VSGRLSGLDLTLDIDEVLGTDGDLLVLRGELQRDEVALREEHHALVAFVLALLYGKDLPDEALLQLFSGALALGLSLAGDLVLSEPRLVLVPLDSGRDKHAAVGLYGPDRLCVEELRAEEEDQVLEDVLDGRLHLLLVSETRSRSTL